MELVKIAYQSGFDAHTFRCLEGQRKISPLKEDEIKARLTLVIHICSDALM